MIRSIVSYFVDKTLLNHLIVIFLLWAGVTSFMGLQRQARPNLDLDRLTITTIYPGASPEDVELYVTALLERELETISGIEEMTSVSREGTSQITIKIDPEASDKRAVKNEIAADIE